MLPCTRSPPRFTNLGGHEGCFSSKHASPEDCVFHTNLSVSQQYVSSISPGPGGSYGVAPGPRNGVETGNGLVWVLRMGFVKGLRTVSDPGTEAVAGTRLLVPCSSFTVMVDSPSLSLPAPVCKLWVNLFLPAPAMKVPVGSPTMSPVSIDIVSGRVQYGDMCELSTPIASDAASGGVYMLGWYIGRSGGM